MKKILILMFVLVLISGVSMQVFADSSSQSSAGAQAGAGALAESNPSMTLNQGGSTVHRGFVFPNTTNFVGAPNDFGNGQQYSNFVPAGGMLQYTKTYKQSELASIVSNNNVKLNARFWIKGGAESSEITFGVGPGYFIDANGKQINMIQCGMATIRVEKGREDSFELLGQLGLAGAKKGATHALIIGEGAQSFMDVSGWGIALGYTHAYINTESASQSGVGTAGIGYTSGKAERKGNPFMQVLFLIAKPEPVQVNKPEEAKAVPIPVPVDECKNPPQISVKFQIGKDNVEPSQKSVINEMSDWLKKTKCLALIKGGASKEGGSTYNAGLGLRRAENVKASLIAEGVNSKQLVLAVSSGENYPVSSSLPDNRESDIITIGGQGATPLDAK